MNELILGTRGSALALAQSQWVANEISRTTGVNVRLQVISTKGDRILDKPLAEIGGKGLFTAELEAALRTGEIHFAVHSLKDLPTEDPEGLSVVCIPKREDPRDALVGQKMLDASCIGTGSLRRQAQIRKMVPNVELKGIRGNVDTRIAKMERGEYDSIVLAMAGLNRLGIVREDVYPISIEECVPAAGQGALALQCASHREDVIQHLQAIHHRDSYLEITAERAFLEAYGGGCHVAAGCIARCNGHSIEALAMAEDNQATVHTIRFSGTDPINLGRQLAAQLLQTK